MESAKNIDEMMESNGSIEARDEDGKRYLIIPYNDGNDSQSTGVITDTTPVTHQEIKQGDEPHELRVYGRIGQGAFANVYKVNHKRSNARAAKDECLKASRNPLFCDHYIKKEIDIFNTPDIERHEHIITRTFACVGSDVKAHYLGLEYFDGRTLKDIIGSYGENKQRVSHADLVTILRQQVGAIKYLLGKHIYHCDISPSNLMYNEGSRKSKLIDFGLAKVCKANEVTVKSDGGALAYAAPETFRDGVIGDSSDLYSLAATMFHLMTLEVPPCVREHYSDFYKEIKRNNLTPDTPIQSQLQRLQGSFDEKVIDILHAMLDARSGVRPLCKNILEELPKDNVGPSLAAKPNYDMVVEQDNDQNLEDADVYKPLGEQLEESEDSDDDL